MGAEFASRTCDEDRLAVAVVAGPALLAIGGALASSETVELAGRAGLRSSCARGAVSAARAELACYEVSRLGAFRAGDAVVAGIAEEGGCCEALLGTVVA